MEPASSIESSVLICTVFHHFSGQLRLGIRWDQDQENPVGGLWSQWCSVEPENVVPSPDLAVPHGASKQLSSSYMSQQILWLLPKPTT